MRKKLVVGHAGVAGRIGFRELVRTGLRARAIVHEEAVRADELRRHWRQGPDFQLSFSFKSRPANSDRKRCLIDVVLGTMLFSQKMTIWGFEVNCRRSKAMAW